MSTFFSQHKQLYYLLHLYQLYQKQQPWNHHQLAEQLELSTKQFSRYLKRFKAQGYFHYTPGNGRSNTSQIHWNKNIHEVLLNALKRAIQQLPIEEVNALFEDDFLISTFKSELAIHYFKQFSSPSNPNETLLIPIHKPVHTIHPHQAKDIYSMQLIYNVYDRLVSIEHHETVPGLAHRWETKVGGTRFYLRKLIYLHNGVILTAEHVKTCVAPLLNRNSWRFIHDIVVESETVIWLMHDVSETYLLHLLSTLEASIFVEGEKLTGSGPYEIVSFSDEQIRLQAFPHYFGYTAFIENIELKLVPSSIQRILTMDNQPPSDIKVLSYPNGDCMLLFNPNRPYFSAKQHRQLFKQQYHSYLRGVADALPNAIAPLHEEPFHLNIGISKNKVVLNARLKEVFEHLAIPYKLTQLTLNDYIEMDSIEAYDAIIYTNVSFEQSPFHQLRDLLDEYSFFSHFHQHNGLFQMIEQSMMVNDSPKWQNDFDTLSQFLQHEVYALPLFTHIEQLPYSHALQNLYTLDYSLIPFAQIWYNEK
ncbi:SgrR family transcriptional regulator [Viridibacillus sp. YIM B01967]|uniref:SgrR family transcriptional regulator n=1 Tax=Viridibacillus soli TaxID=2798301 RepID=A0ABS1H405_9BACL|nr:ABC transporter substrate-binding protein [Viridibacillus soli]MBK3494154.1 SgrR family transcriptional regulator [Viridibacillus soli]